MKTVIFGVFLAAFSVNASAGDFASTCRKMNPDNKYLGHESELDRLQRCVLQGFGAHYPISDLQELEAACLKEEKGRYVTVAADASLVDGKPKAGLYVLCWPAH
jgi:hypothetical protein